MQSNNCLICHKSITSSYALANSRICKQCFNKLEIIYKKINIEGVECLIIYEYNDVIKELIVNLKGYKDIELSKVFLTPIKIYLKALYKNYIILPAPSSYESDKSRGFNHVEEIFKVLDLKIIKCFYKNKKYKQSDQHKYQRSFIKDIISIDKSLIDPNKNYLIVDDITTTHSTLKTCIKLLKILGVIHIKCLVVAGRKV